MRYTFYLIIIVLFFITGCSKTNSTEPGSDKGSLKITLTDSPVNYDSVIVTINRVEVHKSGSDENEGWFVINDNPDNYDLLLLRNGASVVLGEAQLSEGHYTQIRLILDPGSYVVFNGISYPLIIPSGLQTGIKLNHEFDIQPGTLYELLLDFDADKSIHLTGSGKYMMNPVITVTP